MKNKIIKPLLLVFLTLMISVSAFGQTMPVQMKPARLLNDYAGVLDRAQNQEIESMLVEIDKTTSTQIAVVTINDLEGMDISQYATELAHQWKIGQKGKDNGILMLIQPKSSISKGKVYIAVGYGLEGAIPDITADLIVRKEVLPYFRKGKYYEGIYSGVNTIKGFVIGEYTADGYKARGKKTNYRSLIFFAIILIFMFFNSSKKRKNGVDINQGGSTLANIGWMMFLFGGRPMGGGGGSGFDSFSNGSGSFGGFGGGDFGGGGAGGEW